MRFASFAFLLAVVTYHDGVVSLSPLETYTWNYRYLLDMFWNYDKCFFDNFYSERTLPAMKRREDYDYISVPSREVISNLRVNDQGPLSLQGVFWLKLPAGVVVRIREAISFAPTEEGGGLSAGTLSDTNSAYRLRHVGDRIWPSTGFPPDKADDADGIVDFLLTNGTITNPTNFQLVYDFKIPGTCIRFKTNRCPIAQQNFTLQNTPDDDDEFPSHDVYDSSVVWFREQTGLIEFTYEAVQIVDGAGNELQPAYDDFIQFIDDSGGFMNVGVMRSDARLSVCTRNNDP